MSDLFEGGDSDSDIEIRTDNIYARKYDTWRKKEELHKLETKYGKDILDDSDAGPSESSSEEDEDAELLTEDMQNKFLKTITLLRSNDPIIYDEKVNFFDDEKEPVSKKKTKPLPNAVLFNKDIVENESDSESDDENEKPESTASQGIVKLTSLFDKEDIDKPSEECPVKVKRDKSKFKVEATEDENYKTVMDYILNKRYIFKKNQDVETSSSKKNEQNANDISEDEADFAKQEEFEYKYNFRFEEPDKEFIKQYPRAIPNSLRITDDSRKVKRAARKERKQKEKEEKIQDLKKMQELKLSEIEEKIKKLKEVTGTTQVEFEDGDIDGDFDPEAHDRRMQALFNDDFYEGEEMKKKPEFPELDEYLEIENWNDENDEDEEIDEANNALHCEDEDFNMDCDYDPTSASAKKKEIIEKFKDKKQRKRKSLFAQVLSESKPVFDPKDKTYEEYLDEYYKYDCEDLIGGMPCRFKYRKVMPNSFGLSTEEILIADDKELNKWCSVKKILQRRPDHVERNDQIVFEKKRDNIDLKRRLLPSLFKETGENSKSEKIEKPEGSSTSEHKITGNEHNELNTEVGERINKKKKKKTTQEKSNTSNEDNEVKEKDNATLTTPTKKRKKKKKKAKKSSNNGKTSEIEQADLDSKEEKAVEEVPKKKEKRKIKETKNNSVDDQAKNSRKRKLSDAGLQGEVGSTVNKKRKGNKGGVKGKKESIDVGMSDARLSAYGLNPKKFKNKLIYGNTK